MNANEATKPAGAAPTGETFNEFEWIQLRQDIGLEELKHQVWWLFNHNFGGSHQVSWVFQGLAVLYFRAFLCERKFEHVCSAGISAGKIQEEVCRKPFCANWLLADSSCFDVRALFLQVRAQADVPDHDEGPHRGPGIHCPLHPRRHRLQCFQVVKSPPWLLWPL